MTSMPGCLHCTPTTCLWNASTRYFPGLALPCPVALSAAWLLTPIMTEHTCPRLSAFPQLVMSHNTPVTLLTNFQIVPGHTVTSICIPRFPELMFCARTWMHFQWCYSTHMSHCFRIFWITEDIQPGPYLLL